MEAELTKLANLIRSLSRKNTTENVASDIERIRSFYDPLIERLYENADPRKRDLEQLEQISSAYTSPITPMRRGWGWLARKTYLTALEKPAW